MSVLAETSLMAGAQARVNYTPDGHIYLRPRPLALAPGSFILLPLLPASPPIKTLPAEIWASIFILLLEDDVVGYGYAHTLMHVSKGFKASCLHFPLSCPPLKLYSLGYCVTVALLSCSY
jgi:hypothetical protein